MVIDSSLLDARNARICGAPEVSDPVSETVALAAVVVVVAAVVVVVGAVVVVVGAVVVVVDSETWFK